MSEDASPDPPLRRAPTTAATPPPSVLALLDGTGLEAKVGIVIDVITADLDGWPRPAQLSAGEVLLSPAGDVRLALHATSSTTANLRRDGRVALVLAADGATVELRARVAERAPLDDPPLATFAGRLVAVREHRAPYADVLPGLRFTLRDPDATVARWRRQIVGLRALDGAA